MSTRRRKRSELIRDRRRIADLYLQGWTQIDIGEELGINQSTVSRDLVAIQADWLESTLVDFNEAKAQEIAKVDRLEREYWQAWVRSCEDVESITQEGSKSGDNLSVDKVKKTRKGQAGDPRFLAGVQWCIERRCKILGIDAASKLDVTSKGESVAAAVSAMGTLVALYDALTAGRVAPSDAEGNGRTVAPPPGAAE